MTSQQAAEYQKMTPMQQQAIQSELSKTGGVLAPDAINALKTRPEFKGLTPDDIVRGKEQLAGTEKSTATQGQKAETGAPPQELRTTQDPKKTSLFERMRQFGKYQDISLDLKPFGYEFFQEAAVRVLSGREDVPVPLKYVVGPGDEVKISLWGRVNASYNLTVDRDGKIAIPGIGPLSVAGMNFEDMSNYLIKQAEQMTGTNVDISMGSLKTIPIFVLGDVKRPGSYTIGSFATITDALLAADGPSEIGSMRKIELRRKNRLVTSFDLYDLFLKGDKSRDVVLSAGDVIFVPVTGPLCAIAGNVKRPAIYEFKDKFDLGHLFALSGGIIPSAYMQQIQVERIVRGEKSVVVDINDKTMEKARQFVLQDADLVKVFSIVDQDENAVYLSGNVKYPGKYAFKPGMRIKDLLKGPDDLQKETYFDYALIKRESPPGREIVLLPFNLGKLVLQDDPAVNLELTPKDHVYIFSSLFFQDRPYVSIEGEIRGDCGFDIRAKQEELKQGNASALSRRLDAVGKTLRRGQEIESGEIKSLRNDLVKQEEEELEQGNASALSRRLDAVGETLRRGQTIESGEIKSLRNDLVKAGKTEIAGKLQDIENDLESGKGDKQNLADRMKEMGKELRPVCRMELFGNMTVKDVILGSGGLTDDAFLEKGEIIRRNASEEFSTHYFHVARAMSGDPRENLLLQKDDRIVIHSVWEGVHKKTVYISGEVTNPGSYQCTVKMTVRDLLFKAGNVLDSAYLGEAELASMDIEKGKTVTVVHRRINLGKALEGDALHNVVLKPYDRLLVKRINSFNEMKFVEIAGEVGFPARYTVMKGERLSSLIERAGGYRETAYLRGAYFTRESVRELQRKALADMADRVERELLTSTDISTAVSVEEVAGKKAELEQKKQFVQYLRGIKATGRMTIKLAHLRLLKGSDFDIELEDGDSLFLPPKNKVVTVTGAVMSQGSYIYSDGMDYDDYIGLTGGLANNADTKNTFVLKVDGSALKVKNSFFNWSSSHNRWEMANFGEDIRAIEPGDTIIVPEKIEKIAWLREFRDITQILMNTAVMGGALKVIF
jgi:protein involved in polysaccharide export with SLBB domain